MTRAARSRRARAARRSRRLRRRRPTRRPSTTQQGRLVNGIPFTPTGPADADRGEGDATPSSSSPKVKDWVGRYPKKSLVTQATYDATYHDWDVKVWSGPAGEIASGRVDDASGVVTEAWTGPQVAWTMARGGRARSAARRSTAYTVWLAFCAVFLLGLADLRRPLSLRNLDLLALLSFSVSLWYFNHGQDLHERLARLPRPRLPARADDLDRRSATGRRATSRPLWPVWLLAAATVFLGGFKVGLNVRDSNVIDVGFAGPIGAERIAHGQSPYGNFPIEDALKACGPADRDGEIRERIQTNGRCEAANPNGDTYGPVVVPRLPARATRSSAGAGSGTTCPRRTSRRSSSTCSAWSGSASSGGDSAGTGSG